MDRGAWWVTVHGVAKSRTGLKRLSMHACILLAGKDIQMTIKMNKYTAI